MNFLSLVAADYAKAVGCFDLVEVLGAHMQNDNHIEAVNGKEKIDLHYVIVTAFSSPL